MKDYLLIQEKNEGLGQIAISTSVINEIIQTAIHQDKNVFFDEIRGLKTTPTIDFKDNNLEVLLKVRVQYGQDVEKSCVSLQKELIKQLQLMVDYHNPVINFNVVGFKFD